VTREAKFFVEPTDLASVSRTGLLVPRTDGRGVIRAEFKGQSVEIPVEISEISRTRPVSYRLDVVPVLSKAGCNMGRVTAT